MAKVLRRVRRYVKDVTGRIRRTHHNVVVRETLEKGSEYISYDMFCTGVKDVNLKTIYEHDIFEVTDTHGTWRGVVKFLNGVFSFDYSKCYQVARPKGWKHEYNPIKSNSFFYSHYLHGERQTPIFELKNLKVVGNIYQHSKLMGKNFIMEKEDE